MKCCDEEFVGRRCPNCGTLPKENEPRPASVEEIILSRKFQSRLYTSKHPKTVRFSRDEVPWNQW